MAVASAFARSFGFVTVAAVADVSQILTAIRTLLTVTLAQGDRWTEVATDTYLSPADPVSGAQMKIQFTRAAAGEIQFIPFDKNGTGPSGTSHAITGWTSSETAKIFAGPTHFFIYRISVGTGNGDFQCYVVDPSPEAMNAALPVNFHRGFSNNGGAAKNIAGEAYQCIPVDGIATYQPRGCFPGFSSNPGLGNATLLTAGGSELVIPMFMVMYPGATLANPRLCGQVPQVVWVDQARGVGQQVQVPIDNGVIATFETVNQICDGFTGTGGARMALRVA